MTKLNQILAVEKRVKATANEAITSLYHRLQKDVLFKGIRRKYTPLDEESRESVPEEFSKPSFVAEDLLKDALQSFVRLFDIEATKDYSNQHATADVVLDDGTVILTAAPVTYLLWLEKQLVDIETMVKKIPTLDPSQMWTWDNELRAYRTPVVKTVRTKKVPQVLVKFPATDKHPAQTETYMEDVQVGTWSTEALSSNMPMANVRAMLDRVQEVQRAVKFARETANSIDVIDQPAGRGIVGYIINGRQTT